MCYNVAGLAPQSERNLSSSLICVNSTTTKADSQYPWALSTALGSGTVFGSGTVLCSGTVPWTYTSCSSHAGTVALFLGTILIPICTNLTYLIQKPST